MPEGPYDKLGLKVGDVIVKVNNDPVASPQGMVKMHKDLKSGQPLALQVLRNGRIIYLSTRKPKK